MKTLKQYICTVRFPIILIVCLMILGSIGYYCFTTASQTQTVASEQQAHEHELFDGGEEIHDHDNVHGNDQGNALENEHHNYTHEETTTKSTAQQYFEWEINEEIQILREYLRIKSVHPDINYTECVYFLEGLAANLDLSFAVHYPFDDKNPVVVLTWEGSQPELPSIVLNSHMDVVPVYEELWTHPPFGAEMSKNGDIFARGAQDMKSIGMMYLGAIRALKRNGFVRPKQTIYVLFVPDEELAGRRGMEAFVKTAEFKALNIGLLLDEGRPVATDGPLGIFHGERTIWQIQFTFHGHSGHGSMLFEDTPGEKLSYLVAKFMEFRRDELRKLNELKYPYGNVTTINLTVVRGGVENNVIPAQMSATFDIRISVNTDLHAFEHQIEQWCQDAGDNITIDFVVKGEKERVTPVDESNPYWRPFENTLNELGFVTEPTIRSGASDSRFVRREGVLAYGFSPLPNTTPRLHDHDEYVNAGTYLKGIETYIKIITNLAS